MAVFGVAAGDAITQPRHVTTTSAHHPHPYLCFLRRAPFVVPDVVDGVRGELPVDPSGLSLEPRRSLTVYDTAATESTKVSADRALPMALSGLHSEARRLYWRFPQATAYINDWSNERLACTSVEPQHVVAVHRSMLRRT
ncbi:hypothetical protein NMY22_g3492 [Coprinellus aureogranulatus]|nr:hypothetical protein NMY22_g3492 [Coprinellus aureogranulatus]